MNRREFTRRALLIASGFVAADQLELLDRLGWHRTLFPGTAFSTTAWHHIETRLNLSTGEQHLYLDDKLVESKPMREDGALEVAWPFGTENRRLIHYLPAIGVGGSGGIAKAVIETERNGSIISMSTTPLKAFDL